MRQVFIPSLLGRDAVSNLERDWLSLPVRYGGLGLYNPLSFNASQHFSSVFITQPLVELLSGAVAGHPSEVEGAMSQLKHQCTRQKEEEYKSMEESVTS